MNNSLSLKKAFTFVVAAATIVATAGLSAFVPAEVSAASYGDLIKGETLSTVYYYGSDGQRYSFPNEKTYFSWFADFDDVVEISDEELADITLAGNVVYRSGTRWVKITSDEKTYAVAADGTIHWIESEDVAVGLAGSDWNTFIDDVPDVFFVDYTVGDSLTSADEGYEGMLWTDGTDTYLVWDGELSLVEDLDDNGFQAGFVLDGTGFDSDSLTAGDDVTGELAYLTDAAQLVETEDYTETQEVAVTLSNTSPSSGTLIDGTTLAHLASYKFTNSSSSDVTVTSVTVNRAGVSSDSTITNSYLFDGWTRLTDAATVSSGSITWNDTTGLFTIPEGGSYTLDVRSNIAAAMAGQTLGVSLDPDNVVYSGAYESTGSALAGALHSIAAKPSASFATLDFTGTTTPATASIDPAEDVKLFERTLTVGVNEVELYMASFRNIGSINATDITDWTLYVGGVQRGDVVASTDSNGYVTFDLSDSPVTLNTGNHQVKVMADVIGGSGRTVTVGLRNAADFLAFDQDYDQGVLATVGAASFSAMDSGAQTINSGSLTITKATDSPATDVIDTASGVTLGKWTVKAFGESMKVESLRFAVDNTNGGVDCDACTLRNGAVYLNGTQIGSTTALADIDDDTLAYTEYTFGSSFVVVPGTPATLEVRADMVDSDGTDAVSIGDAIVARVVDMNTLSNALRMTSGSYIDAPDGSVVLANSRTVAAGSLTVAKNTSYANQTTVDPKTAYKVGSFTVTAGTSEGVNLTDINVDFDTDSADLGELTNLYVQYGPTSDLVTSSTKGTVAETANSWNINYELEAGETIYVNVYTDIDSAISAAETIIASVDVNGNTVSSGTTPTTAEIDGQTITIGTAAFTEYNSDHPVAAIVAADQTVEVARYRFSASYEDYAITELTTSVASATVAGLIDAVSIYNTSGTLIASTVYDESSNLRATFTGLDIDVLANTSTTLVVKYDLNQVGFGAGVSQTNVANTLYSVKFTDSSGVALTETSGTEFSLVNGNAQYVFASIPTISLTDLTNSTLVNGQATDLYKLTVTANANGELALKQFKLTTGWSDGGTPDTLEVESFKLYKNGSDVTSVVTIQDEDGNSIESTSGLLETDEDLVVTFDTEDTISAGETVTYIVRGTPQGFRTAGADTTGDSVSFYMAADASSNATKVYLNAGADTITIAKLHTAAAAGDVAAVTYELIWSDVSALSHTYSVGTLSTGDWHNGYLVKNLDLSAETWSK